ncbi:probable inactive ATP-dependent zinc metalloprotease FTSHI 1, chloroplastic [Daucus carota subsp. sativus]|uniref:probable inactive ATP-dependent zinc metalloprotease FTSHI 1, chloroplastic n=1 Tax=Daucus carota subsp. sativus TaxID=79200 RepID=UPI0007EFA3DE|nr:PREDICTED: probable inactive ATP-dependent zinc metalloprotease FTSHI 1, chloroplastic [Daucus carota subsp. sativus]
MLYSLTTRHFFPYTPPHLPTKTPLNPSLKPFNFTFTCSTTRRRSYVVRAAAESNDKQNDDFVTRVLKQNPSQVEPKFLIGDKLYTLKEKEGLVSNSDDGLFGFLSKRKREEEKVSSRNESGDVFLKDLLREYRGKLYVPEQVFGQNVSQEEEFKRNLDVLPRITFEDFLKAMRSDQVKVLSFVEDNGASWFRDFVVELKEIPGDKNLQRTKWTMKLYKDQAKSVLEEYTGTRYEIEKNQLVSSVGKLPEYPHPVASSISSRIVVELGMLTAVMAAAAAVVGGFLASAVLAVTSFVFVTALYVIWPIAKPLLKLLYGLVSGMIEIVGEKVGDLLSDGGINSKLYEIYISGNVVTTLRLLVPIIMVFVSMALLLRFTLSRRPKNFRKWDIWQGIEFSQSKPQARVDGSTGVTFSDVAGIEEAVEELQELVRYLKNPELFDKMGIKAPHGVLLEGPPGCGKTLVAKAIAGEAGVPFYQMAGSEFVEVLVGVGSARIRDLFKRAKVNKPSVIFIDEIDALATRRQGTFTDSKDQLYNAATQERETTLNQLLIELDGFDTGKGVIFLGATNRKDLLDPALLRPGRFDRKIKISAPNAKGRLEILKVHARKVKLSKSLDLSTYAQNLPGWTGARLAQLLQEAALVAVRKNHNAIMQPDLDEAVDRLTVGPKRVAIELGHQGQCRRATTEVGTALTSHLLRQLENANVESCDRISINPRGQTLSQVVFNRLDDESYIFERRPQLLHRLQVLLGGRAAEEIIFGRDTSKASVNYLADASWLARKIITIWNLENPLVIHGEPPPWRKKVKFVGPRLDFEGSLYDDYDLIEPPINFNLDDEVAQRTEQLMRDMYDKTVALLREHNAALLKTVKVLLNQKEITGEEINFIIKNYPPHTPTSLILEERDPGGLPFRQSQEEESEVEYSMLPQ